MLEMHMSKEASLELSQFCGKQSKKYLLVVFVCIQVTLETQMPTQASLEL